MLVKHEGDYLNHSWLIGGKNKEGSRNIIVSCTVGMEAWAGGEKPYWIDPLALTEPFLARLPAKLPSRPGYYERVFLDGYFETVTEGGNRIKDPILGSLYNDYGEHLLTGSGTPERIGAVLAPHLPPFALETFEGGFGGQAGVVSRISHDRES